MATGILPSDPSPLNRLNERQRNVLDLVCRGFRNAEIGSSLGVSERTVKGYVRDLFLLFDVSNRTELAGMVSAELQRQDRDAATRNAQGAGQGGEPPS